MVPRGHLKTSLITIGVSVLQIIRNQDTRGFILHKLPDEAKGFLGAVKSILLGKTFRHYFPDIIPDGWGASRKGTNYRWSEEEIEVARSRYHPDATIEAKGLRSTVEGAHPIWAIADDLVDREISASPTLMRKAIDFRRKIGQVLEDPNNGFFIVVGTAWPGGFYEEILEDGSYVSLIVGCYQDERSTVLGLGDVGQPIWPERYSIEALDSLRREMTDYVFEHQYLNRFTSPEGFLSARDFRYYEFNSEEKSFRVRWENEERTLRIDDADDVTLTIDPATGAGDDDAAITVVASYFRSGGFLVVADVWARKASPEAQVRQAARMAKRWGVKRCGIERGGWPMYQSFWYRVCHDEGVPLVPTLLTPARTGKHERIASLVPWIREGRFFISRNHHEVVDQFLRYSPLRKTNRDDILDSLAYHLQMVNTRLLPAKRVERVDDDDELDDLQERRPSRYSRPLFGFGRRSAWVR